MRLFLLLTLVLAGLAFLLALATAPAPAIERPATLTLADLDRGRAIVETLDLKRLKEGEERRLRFAQQDLALALNWLVGSLGRGGAEVEITPEQLRVRASVRLYKLPRYLNLSVAFQPQGELLAPTQLRLGKVPLPASYTGKLLGFLLTISPAAGQYQVVRDMLRQATLRPGQLELTLVWRGAALRQAMKDAGWNPSGVDDAALEAYRERLAATSGKDMAPLLGAAFALAKERSRQNDPVAENRAALTALAEVAVGGRLIVGANDRKHRRKGGTRLGGRGDFAQHFGLSAFISIMGGEGISDLAGLYKELRDERDGSGFSFNDLAADKAGSRLGEVATRSPESARRVQERLAGTRDERLFFPEVKDLPEFMNSAQFERRFGGVGQPAYVKQVREIEARIAALPLYRK
ncbi:MAG: hypothetical protein Q8M09_07695 [Pseudomonadota bacterium]|nr:hypothetical protein [Pseudomonadota bacterium]MDP1904111.1 hypothetical protein [Pseudomonadota bacterium]MDP2354247.1 hypothetical protein [Pseudomonadota bacterium]